MILCLDVGNSHIYGGIFENSVIKLRFRRTSKVSTSDEVGIFMRAVLRENSISHNDISAISICSVVPNLDYSLRAACMKYFDLEPFVLQAGVKTGLKVKYRNPIEVGSDRIANAIAATNLFPNKDCIILDFGTATTFCAINSNKEYLGGAIMPGMRLSMESLTSHTAKLPPVEIIKTETAVGRSTVESLQSGLYYMTLGAAKEIIEQFKSQVFVRPPTVIATGGFSHIYDDDKLFDIAVPDLVLQGLHYALKLNKL